MHALISSLYLIRLSPPAIILALLSLSSCASSLVYSPSLDLAPNPLKRDNGQIMGGGELLPETRPNYAGHHTTPGLGGSIKYGFSEAFSLQVKSWYDLSQLNGNDRQGYSGSVVAMINDSTAPTRIAVIPTYALLFNGSSIDGRGVSVSLAAWFPASGNLHPYLGFGPAIGWRQLSNGVDGFGLIANAGAEYNLTPSLTLTGELSGILQIDRTDRSTSVMGSPKISLGWLF